MLQFAKQFSEFENVVSVARHLRGQTFLNIIDY